MTFSYKVLCKECNSDTHTTKEVEVLNVEEDFCGRDVLTFLCPETQKISTSLVFGANYQE